jgi:outer membrane receptor protein involved in Fe transport
MLFAAAHAGAQQPETSGASTTAPPVEVSAYRVPLLITETVQGVSLITEEQIEARKPSNVIDLLQLVPGVQVGSRSAPRRYRQRLHPGQRSGAGAGGGRRLRMNDPMFSRGGAYDLSSIDPATSSA